LIYSPLIRLYVAKILINIFKIYLLKGVDVIRTVICEICEKPFETSARNAKYCSDECRDEGARLKREKWEEETNYNERQRRRMAEQRKAEQEAIRRVSTEAHRKKRKRQEQEADKRKEERLNALKQRAEQGDNLALMHLAEPNSYEYWEAFRDYELEIMAEYEKPIVRYVNDVSIFDDNFSEKVVSSIKEQGIIKSYLITE